MTQTHSLRFAVVSALALAAPAVGRAADFDTTFTHHTAEVNGVKLHYVVGGKGEPVVLLHGWPQTWFEWRKVMPRLAEKYTVIVPDLRGLGDSSRPAAGYDKRTVAEDVHQLVRQLGHRRVHVVGHDWGGAVAYAYAAAHRDEVGRLAVVEMVLPGFGIEEFVTRAPRDGDFSHMPFHMARDIPEMLVQGRERLYISWFYRHHTYNKAAFSEADIDEYARCYAAPGALRAGFEYYRAIPQDAEHNAENARTKLAMPVLALGGSMSIKGGVERSMRAVAADVRGGVIERCGHFVPEERPDELADRLLLFFGGDAPRRQTSPPK